MHRDTNPATLQQGPYLGCWTGYRPNILKNLPFGTPKVHFSQTTSKNTNTCSVFWIRYGLVELELESQSADDALGRVDDEQLVVHRLVRCGLSEEIPDADEHFPFGGAEIHERERLSHLHVEPRIERRAVCRRLRDRRGSADGADFR